MPETVEQLLANEDWQGALNLSEQLVASDPSNAKLRCFQGLAFLGLKRFEESAAALRKAFLIDERLQADAYQVLALLGQMMQNESVKAQEHLAKARQSMPGPDYRAVIAEIHKILKPSSYVEIGLLHGDTLLLALKETKCVGMDPDPQLKPEARDVGKIYKLTSDDFFAQHDLKEAIGEDHFRFAFIDGLHIWEQAFKDFINLEKYADKKSIIVIHDCLPLDRISSERVRDSQFWSGDVWKVAVCLREERPDLKMAMIPTFPTGLCIVAGMDATSTKLGDNFVKYEDQYSKLDYDDYLKHRAKFPDLLENSPQAIEAWIKSATA